MSPCSRGQPRVPRPRRVRDRECLQAGAGTPYAVIVVQMLMLGTGLGLTSAPATESILSVLPPAKAGVGSAVNDATREAGGTLGVAIIGSVYTSIYVAQLAHGAGIVGQGLLAPAVGHGAQQGDERDRRGQQDLAADGVVHEPGVVVEGGGEHGVAGHEHDDELGTARHLLPVALGRQLHGV